MLWYERIIGISDTILTFKKNNAKRKGEKPSPGTIYPALGGLKHSGFLDEQKEGKTIVYNLTPKGKKALQIAKRKFSKTFSEVLES